MSRKPPHPALRAGAAAVLVAFAGVFVWGLTRPPKQPATPRTEELAKIAATGARLDREGRDAALVRGLLEENLDDRSFRFGTVMTAASGKRVLPLDGTQPSHRRVVEAIETALARAVEALGREDSPARRHDRINEVSRHFEDSLLADLDAVEGLSCGIPETRDGDHQRSGYPDLRIVDEASGDVFYLDPKLVDNGSWDSSFRSFYFEPKKENLKINDDAVHLLVGIGHDGNSGAWRFGPWKIIDLSTIRLRLKPEFQASNRDLYPDQ